MNNENKFTRLTLEQDDLKVTWEVPYNDVSGEDMMQAIRTIMIGMTFNESTVESAMASYLEEHSNEYKVIDKSDEEKLIGFDFDTQDMNGRFPSPEEYT